MRQMLSGQILSEGSSTCTPHSKHGVLKPHKNDYSRCWAYTIARAGEEGKKVIKKASVSWMMGASSSSPQPTYNLLYMHRNVDTHRHHLLPPLPPPALTALFFSSTNLFIILVRYSYSPEPDTSRWYSYLYLYRDC